MSRRPPLHALSGIQGQGGAGMLLEHGIRISMDGKGCWRDSVFIERVWRSFKYEEAYLHAYETVSGAREGIGRHINFYNTCRPH